MGIVMHKGCPDSKGEIQVSYKTERIWSKAQDDNGEIIAGELITPDCFNEGTPEYYCGGCGEMINRDDLIIVEF